MHHSSSEDGTVVSNEIVTVERTIKQRGMGLVCTCVIWSEYDQPIAVQIVDDLPRELPAERVAFNPEAAPERGEATDQQVVIADIVATDEPVEVMYGIHVSEAGSTPSPTPPRIEWARPLDEAPDDGMPLLRGGGVTTTAPNPDPGFVPDDEHSGGAFTKMSRLFGPDQLAASATEPDPDTTTSSRDDPSQSPTETTAAPSQSGTASGPEPAITEVETVEGEVHADVAPTETTRTASRADTDRDEEPFREGLIPALIAEVEEGDVSETELSTLRDVLGVPSRSIEVKLQHVQARLEDFEAYIQALEEAIDSHGAPAEFFDALEADIAAVQDDIERVQTEVDNERVALERRMDSLASELTAIDNRLGNVDDLQAELETIRHEQTALVDDLQGDITALETQLETQQEALRSDLNELEATIDEFEQLSDQLADIFDPDIDTT